VNGLTQGWFSAAKKLSSARSITVAVAAAAPGR
jgi:hypothetical protein